MSLRIQGSPSNSPRINEYKEEKVAAVKADLGMLTHPNFPQDLQDRIIMCMPFTTLKDKEEVVKHMRRFWSVPAEDQAKPKVQVLNGIDTKKVANLINQINNIKMLTLGMLSAVGFSSDDLEALSPYLEKRRYDPDNNLFNLKLSPIMNHLSLNWEDLLPPFSSLLNLEALELGPHSYITLESLFASPCVYCKPLEKLKFLHIIDCTERTYKIILKLKNIETLSFVDPKITNFVDLKNLNHFKNLQISSSDDISVGHLRKLEVLRIHGSTYAKFEQLASLTNLKHLSFIVRSRYTPLNEAVFKTLKELKLEKLELLINKDIKEWIPKFKELDTIKSIDILVPEYISEEFFASYEDIPNMSVRFYEHL